MGAVASEPRSATLGRVDESERRERAEARRRSAVLHRARLQRVERDLTPLDGERAVSLVATLTQESWAASGAPVPEYAREAIPVRFVPRRLT